MPFWGWPATIGTLCLTLPLQLSLSQILPGRESLTKCAGQPPPPPTEEVFQTLKTTLTSALVLRNLDFQWCSLVHTDASETGLEAVLSLEFEGEERLIYISQKLMPTEQRYEAVDREALTIKWAVEQL